jgi:catechol 2,3-dioxygenase
MSIQKVAHVEIKVDDVDRALEFHTETLGLVEMARENGTVYLGCGVDDAYDLALTNGGTGLAHVALQVDESALDTYRGRLQDMGVSVEDSADGEPGQSTGIRFAAPSGHLFELVTLPERPLYGQVAAPKHRRAKGIAPTDLDHVTLRAQDTKGLAQWLQQALDFKISDVVVGPEDMWIAAWTRCGEYHHDIAIITGGPGESLDHVAWSMEGAEHLKRSADLLAQDSIGLEVGPGRHGLGGNLFAYFWAPGGNRYELSAEMPRCVDPGAPYGVWPGDQFPQAFSSWGQMPPESFQKGS